MSKNLKNSLFISISYFITSIANIIFIYYIRFYNSDQTFQDPISWSMITAFFLLPSALIGIFAGILADKLNKKKIMYLAQFSNFIIFMIFAFICKSYNNTIHFCILGLVSNSIFSFYEISLDSSLVDIFGEKFGEKMISFIWLLRAISFIIAPIISEKLYHLISLSTISYINSLIFLISSFAIHIISFKKLNNVSINQSLKQDILMLKSYITKNPIIGFLIILDIIIALFYMPLYDATIPVIANSLKLNKSGIAYIEAASWLGTALASTFIILTGRVDYFLKNLFKIINIEMVFLILWISPMFFNFPISNITILISLAVIDGALNSSQTLGALNYFQVKVPTELRGKMSGLIKSIMKVSSPISTIIYGFILKKTSWVIVHLISIIIILIFSTILGKSKTFKNFSKNLL